MFKMSLDVIKSYTERHFFIFFGMYNSTCVHKNKFLKLERKLKMVKIFRALSIKRDLEEFDKKVKCIQEVSGGSVCKSVGGKGC